jgi:translation initiation factor IF-2
LPDLGKNVVRGAMTESQEPTWVRWVKVIVALGILILIILCSTGTISTGQFLATSAVWLAAWLLLLPLPEITEIAVGALKIKRNVQAAQEVKDRVEELAEVVSAASSRVHTAELKVDGQQKEITEVSSRIKQTERSVSSTAEDLGGVVEAIVEAVYLAIETRNRSPIPDAVAKRIQWRLCQLAAFTRPDKADRQKWFDDIRATLGQSPE